MPVHDWTRVDAGISHHFHHAWIEAISRALSKGVLPRTHHALLEEVAGGLGLTATALTEMDAYAAKANVVAIRHASNHRVVAAVEIVSPENKNNRHGLRAFVEKASELLRAGIHLLVVDLFPPSHRDPQGIHGAIWDDFIDSDFALPADRPLTLAGNIGGPIPETFVEPTAVGLKLMDMPLFLTADQYVSVPLEATYQSAWDAVPAYWRGVLEAPTPKA